MFLKSILSLLKKPVLGNDLSQDNLVIGKASPSRAARFFDNNSSIFRDNQQRETFIRVVEQSQNELDRLAKR